MKKIDKQSKGFTLGTLGVKVGSAVAVERACNLIVGSLLPNEIEIVAKVGVKIITYGVSAALSNLVVNEAVSTVDQINEFVDVSDELNNDEEVSEETE